MAKNEELPENVDLDSEGLPPLEGALREKEITGDPQERIWPPRDYPQIYPAAEEAAVPIVEEPPGAVDRDIASYTGEKL